MTVALKQQKVLSVNTLSLAVRREKLPKYTNLLVVKRSLQQQVTGIHRGKYQSINLSELTCKYTSDCYR